MKNNKLILGCTIILMLVFTACHHRNRTNISINENRNYYQFNASYNTNKTENVQRYLNENIQSIDFNGNYVDVHTVLNDDMKLYIKSTPGRLKIKFDKRENDEEAYIKIKRVCSELKSIISRPNYNE